MSKQSDRQQEIERTLKPITRRVLQYRIPVPRRPKRLPRKPQK